MKHIIKKMLRMFLPAILVRGAALALSDIFSAVMAVELGELISAAAQQRAITPGEAMDFGALFLFASVVCPVLLFFSNQMIFRISIDSEETLFRGVLNQNPTSFDARDAGEVSSKFVDDGIHLRWALIDFFTSLLDTVLMLSILLWFLVNVSFQYTIVVLMLTVFGYGKSVLSGSVLGKEDMNVLKAAQPVKSKMLEAASAICFLSINKLTHIFQEQLEKQIETYSGRVLKRSRMMRTLLKGLSMLWDNLSYLIILLCGMFLAQNGLIAIGTVLTMSSYSVLLSKQFSNLDKMETSRRLIRKLSDDISFALDQQMEATPCEFTEITIQPFCYQMRGRALCSAAEITIQKGDKVAITGENGAGKTTLLHLLTGLRDCDRMLLYLDGCPCGKGHLRWLTSYVDMNANSLGDTVEHYVLSGRDLCSGTGSERALEELRQQYDLCSVWDQSTDTLSGGQRKRADLSRCLLEKRQILAMDEPEVGLDGHWRQRISSMISSCSQTVIFTTHDPEFISAANKIISVEGGKIYLKSLFEAS